MTLNYMSGVWVAAFILGGALLYGQAEKQGALMGTVMLGFVGVVMTLRLHHSHAEREKSFSLALPLRCA
jgi:hypothetical protein